MTLPTGLVDYHPYARGYPLLSHVVLVIPIFERPLNPPARSLVLPFDALRVDLQQDMHTVPRPLGDLCRRYTGVESERHSSVPELVRHLAEWGTLLRRG